MQAVGYFNQALEEMGNSNAEDLKPGMIGIPVTHLVPVYS